MIFSTPVRALGVDVLVVEFVEGVRRNSPPRPLAQDPPDAASRWDGCDECRGTGAGAFSRSSTLTWAPTSRNASERLPGEVTRGVGQEPAEAPLDDLPLEDADQVDIRGRAREAVERRRPLVIAAD